MTVVFGFPSAEHVTITLGVPFSSTGRISDGSRVNGISGLDRWHKARSRTGAGRLQKDLEDLEFDDDCWRRYKRVQHVNRSLRVQGPEALDETTSDALDDLAVLALRDAVVQILTFELIGLV